MAHRLSGARSADGLSDRLSIVLEATADLNEMLAEPERLYSSLLDRLQQAVPCSSSSLQVMDGDALKIVAFRGPLDPGVVLGLKFAMNPLFPNYKAVSTKLPVACKDVHVEYPHFKSRKDEFGSGSIRSWLGVPLVASGVVIGLITLDRYHVEPFTDVDMRLAKGFADHAAVAIRNAGLYRRLEESLATQEALMREMQHRVKNSLQLVASLIDIHAGSDDEGSQTGLAELKVRIESISAMHARLYTRKDMSSVDLDEYLSGLASDIVASFLKRGAGVELKTELEHVVAAPKLAVPLGLITSELIMNALKYAFPAGAGGTVLVSLHRAGDTMELCIGDDGAGIPPGRLAHGGFGTQLVRSLAAQVGGSAGLESRPGRTLWTITVPGGTG